MVTIQLYKYEGDKNTVNKELTPTISLTGTLKDYFNTLNPDITVRSKTKINGNYCYIDVFDRYYFINDVIYKDNNAVELVLSIDVLKTYEDAILDATATNVYRDGANKFISNRNTTRIVKPIIEQLDFSNKGLFDDKGTLIMVTIKGGEHGSN
jgi:hypothetical protein